MDEAVKKGEDMAMKVDLQLAQVESSSRVECFLRNRWMIKADLLKHALRMLVYLVISTSIFGILYKTNKIKIEEENLFRYQKVVSSSEIRGMFPPIEGKDTGIIGKWRVSFASTLQIGIKTDYYSDYILEFKSNSNLRVRKQGCPGDLIMRWATYSFNLYISEYHFKEPDSEMVIEPDPKDLSCIEEKKQLFSNLKYASVWSIYEGRLYILIEKWKEETSTNMESIIIMEKA